MTGDKKQQNSDEIDLIKLFIRFINFFRKYFLVFIAALILGVSAGYLISKVSKKYYKSCMTVTTEHISVAYSADMINTLKDIANDKNYTGLARNMNISLEAARQIRKIKTELINDELNTENDIPDRIKIMLDVFDTRYLDTLAMGIEYYISTNPYTVERYQVFKQQTKDLIHKIDSEIREMDDFQKNLYSSYTNETVPTYILRMGDESNIQSRLIQLYKEKQSYESQLKLLKPFIIIEPFCELTKPVSSRFINKISYGFAFLLIAIIIVSGWEINLFTRNYD